MMTRFGRLSAGLLAAMLAVGTGAARAQEPPQIFHINPARSSVTFSIPGSGEAANGKPNGTTNGSFKVAKSSGLRFVSDDQKMTGQIVVMAASETSGDAKRDKTIRSQVLQANQFGTITFTPARYEGKFDRTGTSVLQVHGVLTLQGKPHEMTLPVQIQSNGYEASATTKIVVPYIEWGVLDLGAAGLPGVTKVEVDVKLAGFVTPRN
jgi:polyisoprenoid-binding protein YceI